MSNNSPSMQPVFFQDDSGKSALQRVAGVLSKSDDGGATFNSFGVIPQAIADLIATDPVEIEMGQIRDLSRTLGLGLTRFRTIPLGIFSPPTTPTLALTGDPLKEGGGQRGITAANFEVFAHSMLQNPRTKPWVLSGYSRLAGPNAGQFTKLGWVNTGGTHNLTVVIDPTVDATKYAIQFIGAGTTSSTGAANTYVADSQYHWFRLVSDATTVRLYVDNALASSLALDGNVTDEPLYPAHYSTPAGQVWTNDLIVGVIG